MMKALMIAAMALLVSSSASAAIHTITGTSGDDVIYTGRYQTRTTTSSPWVSSSFGYSLNGVVTLIAATAGDTFVVNAGNGDDYVEAANSVDGPIALSPLAQLIPYTVTGFATGITIKGESGDDTIRGTDNRDYLYGSFGFDTIDGNAGNDVIRGHNPIGFNQDYCLPMQSPQPPNPKEDSCDGGAGDDDMMCAFFMGGGPGSDICGGPYAWHYQCEAVQCEMD